MILTRLKSRIRLRHFRGHGVHSPMAYALVREVFLRTRVQDVDIYHDLKSHGVKDKIAKELQALSENKKDYRLEFYLTNNRLEVLSFDQSTISCILKPYASRGRYSRCKQLIKLHQGMSIDRGGYILLFHDANYRKQHYKL